MDKEEGVWVEFTSKSGVPLFGPSLSGDSYSLDSPDFRDLFLTKLINGELAALKSPAFATRLESSHKGLLQEMVNKITKRKRTLARSKLGSSEKLKE